MRTTYSVLSLLSPFTALLMASLSMSVAHAGQVDLSEGQPIDQREIYVVGIRQSHVPSADSLATALLGITFHESTAEGCTVTAKIDSLRPGVSEWVAKPARFREPMQLFLIMNVKSESQGIVSCTVKKDGECEISTRYTCASPEQQKKAIVQAVRKHWGTREELEYTVYRLKVVPVPGVRVSN